MNRVAIILTALGAMGMGEPGAHPAPQHEEPAAIETTAQGVALGAIGRRIAAASPGDVVEIGEGVYRERIRIDRPVTLIARGRVVIDGGGSGDIVEIAAPDVTVRGFIIRNTGADLDGENAAIRALAPRATIENNVLDDVLFGVDLRQSPDSRVAGNRIGGKRLDVARRGDGLRLWRSDRAVVEDNVIHDGRDAILWYSKDVVVRRNVGRNCRYGLHLMFSDGVAITDNEFTDNSVGVYLMYSAGVEVAGNRLIRNRGPSGYGLGLKETDRFAVRDNLIVGNRAGIYVDGSPFTPDRPGEFTGNTLAHNDVGVVFLPSARGNVFTANNFIDNVEQVSVAGRGALDANRFWDGEVGNFWSDYTGYDQNGDGVGDFVHESYTLFENLLDREPALRLFLFSPAQQAVEFVGRAIPAVRPEPKFCDEVPLMRPQPLPACAVVEGGGGGLGLTGAALLAAGAGVIACAAPRRSRPGRILKGATP
ncbi:MAG: nitrous oxide reductase family maturation protein NosD [Phycisphaerales bacterium]|nr:nitrous oxide reductase family maturation protein NosD [Phycisphaerales bacterium]